MPLIPSPIANQIQKGDTTDTANIHSNTLPKLEVRLNHLTNNLEYRYKNQPTEEPPWIVTDAQGLASVGFVNRGINSISAIREITISGNTLVIDYLDSARSQKLITLPVSTGGGGGGGGAQPEINAALVKSLYESNSNTNAFTDALLNKLNSIANGAQVNPTPAQIKTAYESNDDTNAFTNAEKIKLSNLSGNTNDFTSAEKTKLDGIEDGAEVNVQSNWNETDTRSDAYIHNKPTIAQSDWSETDTSDPSYIHNKPTIPAAQVQSDWSETNTNDPSYIQNKPTIPAAQVQSDWSETNTNDPSFILNKISLAAGNNVTVTFDTNTNTYTISSTGGGGGGGNTMTLNAEQIRDLLAGLTGTSRLSASALRDIPQSDWDETDTSSDSYIQNKPDIVEPVQPNWSETDQSDLSYILNKPTIPTLVQSDWDETDQSDLSYILNKPTIPTLVQSDWDETDTSSDSYIQNKPTIPSAQVQSDWNETDTNDPSFILNKISVVAGDNVAVAFDTNTNEYTISTSGVPTPPASDMHTIYYGGLNSSETLTNPLTQLNARANTEEGTSYNIDVDGTTLNDGWYGVIVLPDGETLSILETHGFNQLNQWTLSSETYNGITYNVYRADNNRGGISYNLDFTIAEG